MGAVPDLLRRILGERLGRWDLKVQRPLQARGKGDLIRNLSKYLDLAWTGRSNCDAILILLDADRDCPLELALSLAETAKSRRLPVPQVVVCANPHFEVWVVGSLSGEYGEKIRMVMNIDSTVQAPSDVETVSNPKGWLQQSLPKNRKYRETYYQQKLTHYIDIDLVYHQSRSFRRLCHAVEELVHAIDQELTGFLTPSPR